MMRRPDDHSYALRTKDIVNGIGDLRRHLFLALQAPGIDVHDPGRLGDTDHAAIWNIGDPRPADDRRHVMLTMAFEADVAQYDHFGITLDLLEGLCQHFGRILPITAKKLLEGAGHARRSVDKTGPFGILACPSNDGSHRCLDLGSTRPGSFELR